MLLVTCIIKTVDKDTKKPPNSQTYFKINAFYLQFYLHFLSLIRTFAADFLEKL